MLSADARAQVCQPPQRSQIRGPSDFLAGSIEMGRAVHGQSELTVALAYLPVTILNPRRDDWDAGWVQDISNKPFKEQVDWEIDQLDGQTSLHCTSNQVQQARSVYWSLVYMRQTRVMMERVVSWWYVAQRASGDEAMYRLYAIGLVCHWWKHVIN